MLTFYKMITWLLWPALWGLLQWRCAKGKEERARLGERMGRAKMPRPQGALLWVHAASVGEAQSALILVDHLLSQDEKLHILVTSGTRTSAALMAQKLPARAFHQFYPLDHPAWVARFLTFWQPDMALWMESELWPNMLGAIKARNIPAILINARLSDSSFKNWQKFSSMARRLLSSFAVILTQTPRDEERFKALGAREVQSTDNLKFSAAPLSVNADDKAALEKLTQARPIWVYASTHKGEEELACRAHIALKAEFPSLLTIIVPRHPERRSDILKNCAEYGLNMQLRGAEKALPQEATDIYIADTLGELGLFYDLCPLACIGRSFSDDGGGGHNPIEAAQLSCVVLHGPNVQYQTDIYEDMYQADAAIALRSEDEMIKSLQHYLNAPALLQEQQKKGLEYAAQKTNVIHRVMSALAPYLEAIKERR